jgi:hypothetical protein
MRRITKGRTVIVYSKHLLENTSLAFRDLYEPPGPGSVGICFDWDSFTVPAVQKSDDIQFDDIQKSDEKVV